MGILGWYLTVSGVICVFISLAATIKFWHRYGHENEKPNSRFFLLVARLTIGGMFMWPVIMWKHLHEKADAFSSKGALEKPNEDSAGEKEQENPADAAVNI